MTRRFKLWLLTAASSCAALFIVVGIASGEWDAALACASGLFVFVWGFPLMAIASMESDQ